ncbi:hypothetical protein [uncultured Nocardioides sp.]|uniref:hypothetical protein n=1 Tax=uncultured Nocardioides sp. TaxID=198441 RepID=UPI002607CA3D|nr:hypothetical protein [uncultured Nocardioides sp.]
MSPSPAGSSLNEGTLAAGVLRAQAAIRDTRTADGLARASRSVCDAAAAVGCPNVFAASHEARGVVAVAVALGDGDLREVTVEDIRAGVTDKVMVVESVAVTGQHVRSAATRLRAAGASWVGGVVVAAVGDPLDQTRLGLDELAS